jgi:hypothetical protein
MAGVVVVTLAALVAFDVAAVATMRRYLLGQTDDNLRVALTLTAPKLGAALGAFDIAFLPARGAQVTLQVAATGNEGGYGWKLSPTAERVVAKPGSHTLAGPAGRTQIRVQSIHVEGGSLVAGTSLAQVDTTVTCLAARQRRALPAGRPDPPGRGRRGNAADRAGEQADGAAG